MTKKNKIGRNYCHQNWWHFCHSKTHQFLQITKMLTKIDEIFGKNSLETECGLLPPQMLLEDCIFVKCTRLACVLSFVILCSFLHHLMWLYITCHSCPQAVHTEQKPNRGQKYPYCPCQKRNKRAGNASRLSPMPGEFNSFHNTMGG